MIRVGNRAIDVYMSGELKPRNRGIVQSSTDRSDKAVGENQDTVLKNQKYYEFDDIGIAAAHAYSVLYQKILNNSLCERLARTYKRKQKQAYTRKSL